MQFSFATHFFQSLSFALLNSIWQVAFLWLIFLIVFNKKENNPQLKYIFLVFIQIVGFAWFLQTFISTYLSKDIDASLSLSHTQIILINQLLFFTGILYLLFVVYHIVLFLVGIQSIEKIKHKNIESSIVDFSLFVEEMTTKLGIAVKVCLKISTKITTPLTVGVFKPIILIPIASINALSTTQLETIILHELAHIKRKDYLVNLMLLGIDLFMFFNPFSRIIKKQIFFERELCCDDLVLQHKYHKGLYAEALLSIATIQCVKSNSIFTLNAVSSNNELLKRVQRIFGIKNTAQNKFNKIVTLSAALLIGLVTLNISSINQKQSSAAKNKIAEIFIAKQEVINVEKKFVQKSVTNNNKRISIPNEIEVLKEKNPNEEFKNDLVETLNYFKPVENLTSHFAYQNIEEENELKYLSPVEPIVVESAVKKYPIITTQKFFIPPTSSKPASIIIVTTTEKEAGKKTVQIDILKGTGTVE